MCFVDEFILNAAVQNPQELYVNEFDSVNLSCPVNSQRDLSALNILWRKSGAVLRMANANQIQNAFNYIIPSVNRADAGIYECIVVSTIYGNMTVDSLKKILHVNCKSVFLTETVFESFVFVCSRSGSENRL